jgi:hypothetical protein
VSRPDDKPREPLVLASTRVDRLPIGTELVIRILRTSTGALRCRTAVVKFEPGKDPFENSVAQTLDDRSMRFADLALDLQRFGCENMANAAIAQLDAGAGKRL